APTNQPVPTGGNDAQFVDLHLGHVLRSRLSPLSWPDNAFCLCKSMLLEELTTSHDNGDAGPAWFSQGRNFCRGQGGCVRETPGAIKMVPPPSLLCWICA